MIFLRTALLVLAGAGFAGAAEVPYAIGFLGGRTLLVGWTFDKKGRPALEILDSTPRSVTSALVALKVGSDTVTGLHGSKIRLGPREYRIALAQGSLRIMPKVPDKLSSEVQVPLGRLIADGQDRLSKECTPLSADAAHCFRLVDGGAVHLWRSSEVWDYSLTLDPGSPRPPRRGKLVPLPERTIKLQAGKPKVVKVEGEHERMRFTLEPGGSTVKVETLPP